MRKTFRFLSQQKWENFERLCNAAPANWSESDVIRYAIDKTEPPKNRRPRPIKDHQELAQILGKLGPLNNNINQLTRRANMGSWPQSDALIDACHHVREMKDALLKALGYEPYPDQNGNPSP